MQDVHCHMLPGIDDGPKRLDEALAMAQLAASDGIRTTIATPHAARVADTGGKEALEQQILTFNHELQVKGIDLQVVMGTEYLLSMELLAEAKRGTPIGLNGSRYLLMEIDFLQYPPYIDDAMFQLQLLGFAPVLAHPERQATIQKQPQLLAGLVERGVLCQITGGSLLGHFGRDAKRSAEYLLKHNLVHLLASDGHTSTRNRPPVMREAMEAVERLVGEEAAHCLVVANPAAVMANSRLTLPTNRPSRRRKFSFLGGREPRS